MGEEIDRAVAYCALGMAVGLLISSTIVFRRLWRAIAEVRRIATKGGRNG